MSVIASAPATRGAVPDPGLTGRITALDWAAVTTVLTAIVLLPLVADLVSERARATLR